MPPLRILSPSEQVADHLKGELLRGRWMNSIPGVPSLAAEMGVNRKTVDAALRQLDSEGVLIPQGAGRKRLIGLLPEDRSPAPLTLGILLYEMSDKRIDYILEIQHMLDCHHLGYIYFNTQNGIEEKNATRSPSITDPHTLVFGRAPFP